MMKDDRTIGERVADSVAHFGGSWKFIFSFSSFLVAWILFNSIPYFDPLAFDKTPFILLNLILSFIAAFQAPFIMMSQNRTEHKQDIVYRMLFHELKELIQIDLEKEINIERLSHEIKRNQEIAHSQYERLLILLNQSLLNQSIISQEIKADLQMHETADEIEEKTDM